MFVGKKYFKSLVSFGHPSVEKGQSADENQVSSVSSSRVNVLFSTFGSSLLTTTSCVSLQ